MNKREKERQAEEYRRLLGEEAAARQRGEAIERHWCCGERVDHGHHPMCSQRPEDDPPTHVEGQEALL